jgi:4-hydroxybenzoate polyprenyltransferase
MNWTLVRRRLNSYERLMRLDKPVGALLLLWPTLWAVWLASGGWPSPDIVIIFIAGTFLMRSSGCAINDYADRDFDPHVARTRDRPLAAREIRPWEALALAAALALLAFCLVLFLNRFALLLSIAALAIAASYPYAKRFFPLPQAYLGLAFGFGIPMAYAAVQDRLPVECWLLLAANVFYSFAYDTEYAMVDRNDDAKLGLRTAALTLGRWDVVAIMSSYVAMLLLLALTGTRLRLEWPFYAGLAGAAGLMVYHWRLIRDRSREGCFKAFRSNNWVGALILLGIVLGFPFNMPWR